MYKLFEINTFVHDNFLFSLEWLPVAHHQFPKPIVDKNDILILGIGSSANI